MSRPPRNGLPRLLSTCVPLVVVAAYNQGMRIIENNSARLVLKGTPGTVRWMLFASAFGLAAMTMTAWFAWISIRELQSYWQLIPLGLGFLMGCAFFLIGLISLAFGRMKLELDRVRGTGSYDVYSPIIEVGKPCTFRLEDIDSVTVERRMEARHSSEGRGSLPAQVCEARLRIRKPRRAIVLDETQNGQDRRVQAVADTIGEWLGLEVSVQAR